MCHVYRNTVHNNGHQFAPNEPQASGIFVAGIRNRIENNHCAYNKNGIYVAGQDNFVVSNSAIGNDLAYQLDAANNIVGPVVAGRGTISSTNPWANFSN